MCKTMTTSEVVSYICEKIPEVEPDEVFLYLVEHTQPPYSLGDAIGLSRNIEKTMIIEGSI